MKIVTQIIMKTKLEKFIKKLLKQLSTIVMVFALLFNFVTILVIDTIKVF